MVLRSVPDLLKSVSILRQLETRVLNEKKGKEPMDLIYKTRESAEQVLSLLPDFWEKHWIHRIPRVSEEISWILKPNGTVVDLGGSSGFHCMVCSNLGMKSICVDNFKVRPKGSICDCWFEHDLQLEKIAAGFGVEFIHTDILDWDPPFDKNSIDVVMTLDTIEHLHRSPRKLYKKMVSSLRPGGLFLFGTPNAANVVKRIRVLFGKNVFSRLDEWYIYEQFIGHVREPTVSDLRFIAHDLDLTVLAIKGRNWLGLLKQSSAFRFAARISDRFLRCFPSLCSDIYLLASKKM